MRSRNALGTLLALAVAAHALVSFPSRGAEREKVELAIPLHPTTLLTFVALDQGYFIDHGLDVNVKTYPSGKVALEGGLFAGTADFAWTTDVPVTLARFHRSDFSVIGIGLWSDNINKIIARSDRHIRNPKDLRGKRIATQKGSSIHYYLHLFLMKHNLAEQDVIISFLKPDELPGALADGVIDAFAMREPFISAAQKKLKNTVVFETPGLYEQVEVLVARKSVLVSRPGIAEKMLASLQDAVGFVTEHPRESASISARFLKISPETIEELMPSFRSQVSLPQSWLILTEAEARWAIDTGLVESDVVPNYLDVIDFGALEEVGPEAVTIIH